MIGINISSCDVHISVGNDYYCNKIITSACTYNIAIGVSENDCMNA